MFSDGVKQVNLHSAVYSYACGREIITSIMVTMGSTLQLYIFIFIFTVGVVVYPVIISFCSIAVAFSMFPLEEKDTNRDQDYGASAIIQLFLFYILQSFLFRFVHCILCLISFWCFHITILFLIHNKLLLLISLIPFCVLHDWLLFTLCLHWIHRFFFISENHFELIFPWNEIRFIHTIYVSIFLVNHGTEAFHLKFTVKRSSLRENHQCEKAQYLFRFDSFGDDHRWWIFVWLELFIIIIKSNCRMLSS